MATVILAILVPAPLTYHLLACTLLCCIPSVTNTTQCGGHLTHPRGFIHTPNFPHPYPVPIQCQWVIEAPSDGRVAVYFTQFYMRRGFSASDYTYYSTRIRSGVGREDFGAISSSDEPTYLISNQRVLVLSMGVPDRLDNVHLRVREHLLDVSGFNITYEVVATHDGVREDPCIYHHCSFTGLCFASSDFQKYSCGCFGGYFGEECQYDEACGPNATLEVCQNGGTCRYYIGSSVRTCECLPGFTGAKCEHLVPSKHLVKTTNSTDDKCKSVHYPSTQGYISIYPKNRKCHLKNKVPSLIVRLEISEPMPVSEGVPLLVACIVVADSGDINVRWLKDGHPIALQASKGRLWSMQVPRDSQGRHTFLLGFDTTRELDTGSITCKAQVEDDKGRTSEDTLSVQVTVLPKPTLLVDPLSATVQVGTVLKITCVAKDAVATRSRYAWKRDGSHIRRWDGKIAEDLYPVGTRLILKGVRQSANYACVMKTPSSTVCQKVAVTVLNETDIISKTCPQEKTFGVRWKVTAVGSSDMHKCPSGYTGYIKRQCIVLSGSYIGWEEPDFSTCLSPTMLAFKKEFGSHQLGYRRKTVNKLLRELLKFLSSNVGELQPAEAEPAVAMLRGIDWKSFSEHDTQSNWNLTLSIASVLFHSNIVKRHYEKIRLHVYIRNITLAYGEMKERKWARHFQSSCLRARVCNLFGGYSHSIHLPWCLRKDSNCSGVTLKVNLDGWQQSEKQDNTSITISTILFKCLYLNGLSDTVTKNVKMDRFMISVDTSTSIIKNTSINVQTTFEALSMTKNKDQSTRVHCQKVAFHNGDMILHTCPVIRRHGNASQCRCVGVGLMSHNFIKKSIVKAENLYSSYPLLSFVTGGCAVVAMIALCAIIRILCITK